MSTQRGQKGQNFVNIVCEQPLTFLSRFLPPVIVNSSIILNLLSFSVRDIPEKYEIDKAMMSIDNKYWCGGYKKWLKFSQEGQGLDKAQNCELAKKAKSEYGETLKWQIRKSESKKITFF